MATLDSSPQRNEVDDFDSLGVINALERTCELESKLRQAIQQTHPLTTTLDWDFNAADREREALLAISAQLEYLEDKLREYRFLKQSNSEQKAVLLGQLDGVRRELLEVLASSAPRIMFAKEIVRDVLNFATAGDDTPRNSASPSQQSSRLPSSREKIRDRNSPLAESSLFSLMSASPKPSLPSGQPSYGSLHENDLWESNHRTKATVPGKDDDLAMPVPGATTTASRNGSRTITQHHDSTKDRSRRYGSSHHHITDEDIYGPAPVIGGGSGNKNIKTASPGGGTGSAGLPPTTGATGASGSDSNMPGGMLKIREMLSRAEKGLSAVAETKEQRRAPPKILGSDNPGNDRGYGTEDWDGISPTGYNTPPPEFDAEPWVPSGGRSGGAGAGAHPHPHTHSPAATSNKSYSVRDWTIKAEPMSASQFTPRSIMTPGGVTDGGDASSTGGPGDRSGSGSGGAGLPGLVGKLAGFAFVLGSIAAATMAATGTLPGSNSKPDDNNDSTSAQSTRNRHRNTSRSSSSGQQRHTSGTTRRSNNGSGADVPPWKDGNGNAGSSAATGGTRRKASSGRANKSSAANGAASHQQGPVMHVHQPPSSGSFPTVTPPDVTAAMG